MKFAETEVVVKFGGGHYHGRVYRITKAKLGGFDGAGTVPQIALDISSGGSSTTLVMRNLGEDTDPEGGRYGSGKYRGTAYAADLILRILEITGSADWSDVAGKYIIPFWHIDKTMGAGYDCVGFKALQSDTENSILIFEDHAEKFNDDDKESD